MAKKTEAISLEEFVVPTNFIANGNVGFGLQYQHNFIVELAAPNLGIDVDGGKTITWNAMQASVPGITLGVEGSNINGYTLYHATERADQDLQITFLEDSSMIIRSYFERWISLAFDQDTKVRKYPEDYSAQELKVRTYASDGLSTYADVFYNVFPFEINDLDFNKSSYEQVMTAVTFKFKRHLIERAL